MGVVSNPRVAKQIRQLLRHQDPDLFQRTTQFQDPHIQAWLCPLDAVPVEVQLVLGGGGLDSFNRQRSGSGKFWHSSESDVSEMWQ